MKKIQYLFGLFLLMTLIGCTGLTSTKPVVTTTTTQSTTTTTQSTTMTTLKQDIDLSGIKFESKEVVYDGNEHSIFIEGSLPDDVVVEYAGNKQVNAGTYTVIARFFDIYGNVKALNAKLTILKADITNIKFESKEIVYDGEEHTLEIEGNLPDGVTVYYTNNKQINKGIYEVTASFKDTTGNYNVPNDMCALLTILENKYEVKFDSNGGSLIETQYVDQGYKANKPLDPTRDGYTFEGWYLDDELWVFIGYSITENITLVAKWEIIEYNIEYELNGGTNNENNPLTYTYEDDTIALLDPYKKGNTFKGWITDDITIPTKEIEITHNSVGHVNVEAIFEANTYIVTFDVNGGDDTGLKKQIVVTYGEYVDLPEVTFENYRFIGWYNEDTKVIDGMWNIDDNVTLVAKWKGIFYTENGITYTDLGKYPQTVVTDTSIITSLNNITVTNELGYVEYKGEEYKQLIASTYNGYAYDFVNGNSINNDSIYYYKVEPIKWRVLQNSNGTYKLLCEYILDNTLYYINSGSRTINGKTIYANNYEYSNLRAWLNGLDGSSYNVDNYTNKGFYDIAFTKEEKELINTILVDNSASTTNSTSNSYACNNTNDKIFLLNYQDAINSSYGFTSDSNRTAILTDYARSKGCYMSTSSSNYGYGFWWLCSPSSDDSYYAYFVSIDGYLYCSNVSSTNFGVRPALEIKI